MGASRFNTSSPEDIFGEDFVIDSPTPLSDIESARTNIILLGKVFSGKKGDT